jgi:serine/threonine-protein kinase RsbW
MGRTLLHQVGASQEDIDEIELVVGELCTNVVRHANSHEKRFQVTLEYLQDRFVVSVLDRGEGFSPAHIAPVGTERPDTNGDIRIGGYGLQLVQMLSDRLEFLPTDEHGTTVRAEIRLHRPAALINPLPAAPMAIAA